MMIHKDKARLLQLLLLIIVVVDGRVTQRSLTARHSNAAMQTDYTL